jgi:hypothetical protein
MATNRNFTSRLMRRAHAVLFVVIALVALAEEFMR